MIVYHNSNNSYEFPTHEDIVKNRKNHVNGVLGLWVSIKDTWIQGFGQNTYEISLDDKEITHLLTKDLINWEKTANKLYDNEKEKEQYYLNLREDLLKKGCRGILFKEINGNSDMGIILDLKIIQSFQLKPVQEQKKIMP